MVFKKKTKKETLQEIYDYNFKQLELSIREMGYGDVSEEAKKRSINPLPLTPIKNTLEDRKHNLIVSSQ